MDAQHLPRRHRDVFEQASGLRAALARLDLRVVVEPLPAGDCRIGEEILIERGHPKRAGGENPTSSREVILDLNP